MFKRKFPSLASLGSDGNTAFLRAARAGHLDKVLEHLKNNVDINTCNANGLNALHLASKDGHIQVVQELLKRGANVDSATKKGNTALHIASLAGQEEVVKLLVEHGAAVNVQSQNGFTPLYMAAQENHDNVVKFLLANGANQSLATEDGFTPLAVAMQQGHDKVVAVLLENDTRGKVRLPALHIAAKKDDCKAAALLLQSEHNPDVTSKSGFTPLHIASHYGNEGIANLLLTKGADVNYSAKHNITPLHVAAKWGKSNMVALLLDRGANIEAKTRDGLTPLHCAARSGHEQVVDMLLERGAPISAKTKNGLAPLHMSSQGDHVDAARILLYHRAPVDDVTVDYLTALHVASHCGHVAVARLLLDRKADPNARALNGFTPLHIACKKNRIKVVELLLKHGASIEATTESGLTPLHVASFMGCMNIVIYLVQNEANPNVTTVRGETPLHLAARANQTDIIRILLRNGAKVDARAREQQTPLHIASRLGNVDIVMLLLQHGASVDSTTKDLYTALHIASKEGQDEVASVLLENGASLEATTKKGFTPLHLAAKYGNMKVAKLLLQRDAPVDAQGKQNGVTPLHVASHYDHQNVALLLLDKGASPHATAKNGHTPLHIAARKNQMDIATTLLEYGAKANSESKAGFTPLHLASQEGHTDMASLLIEHDADVNHKAKNGLTPLHLCAQEDRVDVGSVLIKNKADIDATTKAGYTPLHVASHFGQMGMVKLLLANGASVVPTTAVNYTPLHQASQQGHNAVVVTLLEAGANPNSTTNQGQTALSIAQKLGYISVVETLKGVTESSISPTVAEEKYKVVAPETMQETFMSDSEDEGGEDTLLSEQPYHYLTVDEMKSLGDDSLPIDVTRDERIDNRDIMGPPTAIDDTISPQHIKESYSQFTAADNIDITKQPLHVGFLVSFLVDARGGAMRGCRHSGVRVIVPPRRAPMPLRVTCRYLKRDKMAHPPPLMEGEALASRILELGPVGAKFLGPVMIEVPHFGSLRGKEREIVILRSDNGETWREHTFEASDEAVQDILSHSFEKEELSQMEESTSRTTRILTTEFPHYLAVVSRVRQEVHAIGPEGGMVSSTVVPQVQAVFPQGALTKKIKVGLQAQPVAAELTAKLLGNRVAVSPIVTVEPRRRKFHKPITLTIPLPQAANKGMINQYSGDAPTLRLLCSITGGTTRAQWEDVTGSTPLTFVNDCVSFTTTVSARFWLMDCRNVLEATKMATELYREAIHVPFMAKFVVFAKRVDPTEARLRVFCMTDDKEDKTLEHQEHFTEVAKSRDVEVLEGKLQYVEFAGNLIPVTKSGEQLKLIFRAFKENRLPFTVRVKDPHADSIGRMLFMREPKVPKGDAPQHPICILNLVLPENIIPESGIPEHGSKLITTSQGGLSSWQRLSDISNLVGEDWVRLANQLGLTPSHVNHIKTELCESSIPHQALAMLKMWIETAGNKASAASLEDALRHIGREDIIQQCTFNMDQSDLDILNEELSPLPSERISKIETYIEKDLIKEPVRTEEKGKIVKQGSDKDDGEERKYVAEEKEVEEVKMSVSERRREIEKRLSQDPEEKIKKDQKPVVDILKQEEKTIIVEQKALEKLSPPERDEIVKKEESLSEKETSEEKAVSPEPSHLSFDQKRKTFELGMAQQPPVKQKLEEPPRYDIIQKFISEEQMRAEPPELIQQEPTSEEEEEQLSFQEKRLSFEKGLAMKKPGDKMAEIKRKPQVSEEIEEKETRIIKQKIISEVYPDQIDIEQFQEMHSPQVSKTPPPSPAEFIKQSAVKRDWQGAVINQDEKDSHVAVEEKSSQDIIGSADDRMPEGWPTRVVQQTADFLTQEHLLAGQWEQMGASKPEAQIGFIEKKTEENTNKNTEKNNAIRTLSQEGNNAGGVEKGIELQTHFSRPQCDTVQMQVGDEKMIGDKKQTTFDETASTEIKSAESVPTTSKSTEKSSSKKRKKNKKKDKDSARAEGNKIVPPTKCTHVGGSTHQQTPEGKLSLSVEPSAAPIEEIDEREREKADIFLLKETASDSSSLQMKPDLISRLPVEEASKEGMPKEAGIVAAQGKSLEAPEVVLEAKPSAEWNPFMENIGCANISNTITVENVNKCPQFPDTASNSNSMRGFDSNFDYKNLSFDEWNEGPKSEQITSLISSGKGILPASFSRNKQEVGQTFQNANDEFVFGVLGDPKYADKSLAVKDSAPVEPISGGGHGNLSFETISPGKFNLAKFLDELSNLESDEHKSKLSKIKMSEERPAMMTSETHKDPEIGSPTEINKTTKKDPICQSAPSFEFQTDLVRPVVSPIWSCNNAAQKNEDSLIGNAETLPADMAAQSSVNPTIELETSSAHNNKFAGIEQAWTDEDSSFDLLNKPFKPLIGQVEQPSGSVEREEDAGANKRDQVQKEFKFASRETEPLIIDPLFDSSSFDKMIAAGNSFAELLKGIGSSPAGDSSPWDDIPSKEIKIDCKEVASDKNIKRSSVDSSDKKFPTFGGNYTDTEEFSIAGMMRNEFLGPVETKSNTPGPQADEPLNQNNRTGEDPAIITTTEQTPCVEKPDINHFKVNIDSQIRKDNIENPEKANQKEAKCEDSNCGKDASEHKPYVTTPSLKRREIGGSQRLSREDRPVIRDVSYLMDDDDDMSDEENEYIVTEPFETSRSPRRVNFAVEDQHSSDDECTIEQLPEQESQQQRLDKTHKLPEQLFKETPVPKVLTEEVEILEEMSETLNSFRKPLLIESTTSGDLPSSTGKFDPIIRGDSKKTESPRKEALESKSEEGDEIHQDSSQDPKKDPGMKTADTSASKK